MHGWRDSSRRAGSYLHENRAVLDLDSETGGLHRGGVDATSGREIVLPTVPRADDAGPVDVALGQRAHAMLADVVDRVEAPAGVEQAEHAAVYFEGLGGAVGNVGAL